MPSFNVPANGPVITCSIATHSRRLHHAASSRPAAPPASASTTLSVNNWRITRPRPAPGQAYGNFALAPGGPREQKIGDVGAGHQQDEAHDEHDSRHEGLKAGIVGVAEKRGVLDGEATVLSRSVWVAPN